MADNNTTEITPWSFLADTEAESYFARVDYALKNGKHIQQWKEQAYWSRFIANNDRVLPQMGYLMLCLPATAAEL